MFHHKKRIMLGRIDVKFTPKGVVSEFLKTKKRKKSNIYELCNYENNNSWKMKIHVEIKHTNYTLFKKIDCHSCGSSFKDKWELERHLKSVHKSRNKGTVYIAGLNLFKKTESRQDSFVCLTHYTIQCTGIAFYITLSLQ